MSSFSFESHCAVCEQLIPGVADFRLLLPSVSCFANLVGKKGKIKEKGILSISEVNNTKNVGGSKHDLYFVLPATFHAQFTFLLN